MQRTHIFEHNEFSAEAFLEDRVGVLAISADGEVKYCNESALRVLRLKSGRRRAFGGKKSNIAGAHLQELLGQPLDQTLIGVSLKEEREYKAERIGIGEHRYLVWTSLLWTEGPDNDIAGCIGYYLPAEERSCVRINPELNRACKLEALRKGFSDLDWMDHIFADHAIQLLQCLQRHEHVVRISHYCPFKQECAFNEKHGWQRLDRRQHRRVKTLIPCKVSLKEEESNGEAWEKDEHTAKGQVIDVGTGGMGVFLNREVPVKGVVHLSNVMEPDFKVRGRVAWRKKVTPNLWRCGIKLEGLSSDDTQRIEQMMPLPEYSAYGDAVYSEYCSHDIEVEYCLAVIASLLREKDRVVYEHCWRTSQFSRKLGFVLGLNQEEITLLTRAAKIHDFGKMEVRRHILRKETSLTPAEWEEIKLHAEYGALLVQSLSPLRPLVPIIRHHHERYDGAGYPDALEGNEIPHLARILGVADAVDAMASPRPYRTTPLTRHKIIEELDRESGRQFDPLVAGRCIDLLSCYVQTDGGGI